MEKKLDVSIIEFENAIQVNMDNGEYLTIRKNSPSIWMLNVIKNPNNYNVKISEVKEKIKGM